MAPCSAMTAREASCEPRGATRSGVTGDAQEGPSPVSPVIRNGRGVQETFAVDLVGAPSGPVERRSAGDSERDGFTPRIAGAGLPLRVAMHVVDLTPPEPLITLADPPVTPPEEPMESPAAAEPAELPIVVSLAESRIHALEELQSAALEAQEAIQEHHAAETAMAKAEEIHELALRRLSRVQDRVRDVFNPPATDDEREVASPAERRHEQLLHGNPPDSSTADPHPNWTTADDEDPGVAPVDVPNGVVGGDEPADDAPETVTSAPPRREPVAGESKQDAILAAVVRLGGDLRAVAADRNTTPGNVVATLHNLGRRGRLVPEVIVLLPAIFAKYSSVRP